MNVQKNDKKLASCDVKQRFCGLRDEKTDKAPKAPLAGKKKKRGLDEDGDEEENQRGATKYLKYGKGIG